MPLSKASTTRTKTRWPRRARSGFATTADGFRAQHLKQIEDATPKLAAKLDHARSEWEADFWAHAPLLAAHKSSSAVQQAPPLTAAEIATLEQAARTMGGTVYAKALYSDMAILVEAGYDSARYFLHISEDFATMPTYALSELENQVGQFSVLIDQREQQALIDTITQALDKGQTPGALAASIRDTFSAGYHSYDELGNLVRVMPTRDWSLMVARTELARAQNLGQIALYKEAQIQDVMWVTTEGANVCPECADLDGEIMSLAIYDANPAPLHPNCCCSSIAQLPEIS